MSLSYTHVQTTPSLTWTITHNLNGATMGDVIEDNGGVIRKILPASVKHITDDSMLVEFSEPTKGLVRLIGLFAASTSSGAGSIDPGQYYVAPAFAFFDDFAGTAGSLDGRIPFGDTRAWSETAAGSWLLDGFGHLTANMALLAGSVTAQLPLATSYTNGFAIEVVFASPMQSSENVTGLQIFVAGADQGYGFNFLADFPTAGDLMIQVSGGDTNNEYTMPMPASGVPFTARLEFIGGTHTLLINGSQIMSGAIVAALGSNVKLYLDASGNNNSTDSMLIDSVAVEELAGSLL